LFYIDSLTIRGFRNYRQQQLQFHPRLNLIIGKNAQGKTNLLESIYYLSVNRSFRTNRDQDLPHWEESTFFIKGIFIKDEFKHSVQTSYSQNNQLKILINDNPVNRYDHLQTFPVVIFSPDDLQIIKDGPSVRRRFINLEASRLNPAYLKELKAYQRVLLQRNHLLKEKHDYCNYKTLLEPWDQSLVSLGSNIIRERIKIINDLEQEADCFFNLMTGGREKLSLKYESTVRYYYDHAEMKNNYMQVLLDKRSQEIKKGTTTIGPHLDDLKISINGYDTRRYSSQGQKRTAALALKMAEVHLFKKINNECPVILLDDVFSEFDSHRKENLLDFLRDNADQCFISTAINVDNFGDKLKKGHKRFIVFQGSIKDETVGVVD